MTKSTITREESVQAIFDLKVGYRLEFADIEILKRVARMALAAMDGESWCLPLDYLQGHKDGLEWASQLAEANHPDTGDWLYDDPIELVKAIRKGPDMPPSQPVADSEPVIVVGDDGGDALSYRRLIQSFEPGTKLYRHAQPASEREQVRSAHAEWSQATFGNVGPVGPLKHLSKEALEAAEQPGDLSEWADMQFLLWDAQRRAGITDDQITQAMIDKLAVNKQREWPEPKDGEPRLHIKEQPALTGNSPIIGIDLASGPDRTVEVRYVAPPGYVMVPREPTDEMIAAAMNCEDVLFNSDDSFCVQFGNIYEAMLAAAPQSPGGDHATVPGKWIPVSERMPEDDDFVYIWPRPDFGVELHVGQYCERSHKGGGWYAQVYEQNYGIEWHPITVTHWMPLPAAPQEVK